MRRLFLVVMILVLFVCVGFAQKLGDLRGINQPDGMTVNGNRLFVVEGARFVEFSLKDLSVKRELGKRGEGPGELTVVPSIPNSVALFGNTLMAEGINKVMRFSDDWKLKIEVKKIGRMFRVLPAGEHYVAMQMEPGENAIVFVLSLFDSKMSRIKELHRQISKDRRRELIMLRDTLNFSVYKDKIYVEDSVDGLVIKKFDFKGDLLGEYKPEIPLRKVMESDRQHTLRQLKNDKLIQSIAQRNGGWDNFVKMSTITYPTHFPPVQDMIVADGYVYLKTFELKDGKFKILVLDQNGNLIKKSYLTVPVPAPFTASSIGRGIRMYGISDNIFYFLKENLDTETWELHGERIH